MSVLTLDLYTYSTDERLVVFLSWTGKRGTTTRFKKEPAQLEGSSHDIKGRHVAFLGLRRIVVAPWDTEPQEDSRLSVLAARIREELLSFLPSEAAHKDQALVERLLSQGARPEILTSSSALQRLARDVGPLDVTKVGEFLPGNEVSIRTFYLDWEARLRYAPGLAPARLFPDPVLTRTVHEALLKHPSALDVRIPLPTRGPSRPDRRRPFARALSSVSHKKSAPLLTSDGPLPAVLGNPLWAYAECDYEISGARTSPPADPDQHLQPDPEPLSFLEEAHIASLALEGLTFYPIAVVSPPSGPPRSWDSPISFGEPCYVFATALISSPEILARWLELPDEILLPFLVKGVFDASPRSNRVREAALQLYQAAYDAAYDASVQPPQTLPTPDTFKEMISLTVALSSRLVDIRVYQHGNFERRSHAAFWRKRASIKAALPLEVELAVHLTSKGLMRFDRGDAIRVVRQYRGPVFPSDLLRTQAARLFQVEREALKATPVPAFLEELLNGRRCLSSPFNDNPTITLEPLKVPELIDFDRCLAPSTPIAIRFFHPHSVLELFAWATGRKFVLVQAVDTVPALCQVGKSDRVSILLFIPEEAKEALHLFDPKTVQWYAHIRGEQKYRTPLHLLKEAGAKDLGILICPKNKFGEVAYAATKGAQRETTAWGARNQMILLELLKLAGVELSEFKY